jgi:hypothetical protein
MEPALVIKAVIGLVAFAAWAFGKLKGEAAAAPIAATPPPMPRRTRRVRKAPEPAAPEPAPVAATPAPHLDETSLVVTRPARAHPRSQFRGASALRQAIVAREVLGPPLSLRPPRV